MVIATALPFTEVGALVGLISIASLMVIAGALAFLAVCWIVLGRR